MLHGSLQKKGGDARKIFTSASAHSHVEYDENGNYFSNRCISSLGFSFVFPAGDDGGRRVMFKFFHSSDETFPDGAPDSPSCDGELPR